MRLGDWVYRGELMLGLGCVGPTPLLRIRSLYSDQCASGTVLQFVAELFRTAPKKLACLSEIGEKFLTDVAQHPTGEGQRGQYLNRRAW
jgi:hypothetical protein